MSLSHVCEQIACLVLGWRVPKHIHDHEVTFLGREKECPTIGGKSGRLLKYTPEFKKKTVDYYLASEKTQRKCAEVDSPERAVAEELRALRKEVEQLHTKNEPLTKRRPSLPPAEGSQALPADGSEKVSSRRIGRPNSKDYHVR